MVKLFIHDDAKRDLMELRKESSDAMFKIVALIEQLEADEDLLDRLTQHGFGKKGLDPFNVSQWFEQQRQGNNLWRLKDWDLESRGLKYRVICFYFPKTSLSYTRYLSKGI